MTNRRGIEHPKTARQTAPIFNRRLAAGILLVLGLAFAGTQAIQASDVPIQYFYVPIPEEQFRTYANAQADPDSTENDIQRSGVSITATYNGTIIYFDHWEDGYEYDITDPVQSTSLIWGDGNSANGIPPGFATDVINAGSVITLLNDVPCNPRDQGNLFYDGRDKFASTEQLVVAHAMWPAGTVQTPPGAIGAMLAGAVEVFEVARWGTSYDVPVGTNLGQAGFNWVALSIMAQAAGTTVQVDADASGSYEITQTLDEGQTLFVPSPVSRGARHPGVGAGAGQYAHLPVALWLQRPPVPAHPDHAVG